MTVNSINTNIAAYYAQTNIGIASSTSAASVSRLSSGNRIVRASDDVAALSTGTSLRTSVSALRIALVNASQGNSLLSVADGALSQVTEILQRQKAIALQAGSGSLTDGDRIFLNQEFQALASEIDRLADSTTFNGVQLINGSLSGSNPLRSSNAANTATITGFTTQTGITAVAFTDATGTFGDSTFYGDLSEGLFEVQFTTAPDLTVSYTINGSTYLGVIDPVTSTGASLALTNGEGTITFTIAADIDALGYAASAAGATLFESALRNTFASASAFGDRVLRATDATSGATTLEGTAIEAEDTNATLLDGMTGSDVNIRSQFWNGINAPTIGNFTVIGDNGVGIKFSVQINGRTYTTGAVADATDLSAGTIITGLGTGNLRFFLDGDSTANPNEFMDVDLTNSTQNIDVDNDEGVERLLASLNAIFGETGGGLSFQIGTESTDVLGVSIASATTTSIYEGATLDVLSQLNATTASSAIDVALDTITSLRAGVGALQSRFNFASVNIQIAVQNQDAARGELLDTDIASESTNYATAQVKLQAGISVLAQANQQLQSLLKLIG